MSAPLSVDIASREQNAFVQDWLTAWANNHLSSPPRTSRDSQDWQTYESIIELIQETYDVA